MLLAIVGERRERAVIFPGMDSYLEDPMVWPDLHSRLVVHIAETLQLSLQPRYFASVQRRVYVEGPNRDIVPDVWLRRTAAPAGAAAATAVIDADAPVVVHAPMLDIAETFVEILDRRTGRRVVTVIELISPTNKWSGPGRESYLAKQGEVFASDAHLVEIDLLRDGEHVALVPLWLSKQQGDYDYLVCVNRALGRRDEFDLYPRRLRERLPRIRVPLAEGDPDIPLDLQAVFEQTYAISGYADDIDYDTPCRPALREEDRQWATELIETDRKKRAGGNG